MRSFASDEAGVTSIEYAFIASLIAGSLFAVIALFGPRLNTIFENVAAGF